MCRPRPGQSSVASPAPTRELPRAASAKTPGPTASKSPGCGSRPRLRRNVVDCRFCAKAETREWASSARPPERYFVDAVYETRFRIRDRASLSERACRRHRLEYPTLVTRCPEAIGQRDQHQDFKTSRASQPDAWKVRFLRRLVGETAANAEQPGPAPAESPTEMRVPDLGATPNGTIAQTIARIADGEPIFRSSGRDTIARGASPATRLGAGGVEESAL
jgi:hypothetical protein